MSVSIMKSIYAGIWIARRTAADAGLFTAWTNAGIMFPLPAINLKRHRMYAIHAPRKGFVQKTNTYTVQSMRMLLSHADGLKAVRGSVSQMRR